MVGLTVAGRRLKPADLETHNQKEESKLRWQILLILLLQRLRLKILALLQFLIFVVPTQNPFPFFLTGAYMYLKKTMPLFFRIQLSFLQRVEFLHLAGEELLRVPPLSPLRYLSVPFILLRVGEFPFVGKIWQKIISPCII